MYGRYVKRPLDIAASLLGIIFLSPVLLLLVILVRIKLGSPVLFRQQRVGKDEKVFVMYKFRTMTDQRNADGELLSDEERLTKFGVFLRSTSLDELPELFNILKGDLSVIGPRPLLVKYLPYFTPEERQRHAIRGGLTQPEVLYGKVLPTWDEQFAIEVDYVQNVSFLLDLKIFFATIRILCKRVETEYGSKSRRPLDEERRTAAAEKAGELSLSTGGNE